MDVQHDDPLLADNSRLAARFATAVVTLRDEYISDTRDSVAGRQKIRQRERQVASSIQALEGELADVLMSMVDARRYKVKASAGQPGRPFVLIPYAMLLRRDVTTTPRRGVYIALLFQQDCQAFWLTLNQGLQQFENRFGLFRAGEHLKHAAQVIAASIAIPAGFAKERIDLAASGPYGQAYEQGAILGKKYALDGFSDERSKEFLHDLRSVVALYDTIPSYAARDPSIAAADQDIDDEVAFQEMANTKSHSQFPVMLEDAPVLRPSLRNGSGKTATWKRDVQVAAAALLKAGYRCEAGCDHKLFRAAVADHSYVEAHHLIPLARQADFDFSLDVPANIVSLCPSCHSRVHREHKTDSTPLILRLFKLRAERLSASGLKISARSLLAMY